MARHDHGFTLAELMIVCAVLAVLLAAAIPTLKGAVTRAHDSVAQSNLDIAVNNAATRDDPTEADTSSLSTDEPALSFVSAASTGPRVVSVGKTSTALFLATKSDSGKCFLSAQNQFGVLRYTTTLDCDATELSTAGFGAPRSPDDPSNPVDCSESEGVVSVCVGTSTGAAVAGATVTYYANGWLPAGTTDAHGVVRLAIPAGHYHFQVEFGVQSQTQELTVAVGDTVRFFTIGTTVQLRTASSNGLSGGAVTYYGSGWTAGGTTDTSGAVALELLPGQYYFAVDYNHGHRQVGPLTIDANNTTVTFTTIETSIRLRNSSGGGLSGATMSYYGYEWGTAGSTDNNGDVAVELLPGQYYFSTVYGVQRQQVGPLTIDADNKTVTFTTVATTIRARTSTGAAIAGATITYYGFNWATAGTTDAGGDVAIELLPNNYYFSITSGVQRQQIGPMPIDADNHTVSFTTVLTTVQARTSTGAAIPSATITYYGFNWATLGTTDANGNATIELLPNTYYFAMAWHNQHQQQNSIPIDADNKTVTFTTVLTTVSLRLSTGTAVPDGVVEYYGTGWYSAGTTAANGDVTVELLPGTYYFSMAWNNQRQQVDSIPINAGNTSVTFTTTQVTVHLQNPNGVARSGGSVAYYGTGWYYPSGTTGSDGNLGIELLADTYSISSSYNGVTKQQDNIAVPATTTVTFTF